MPSTRERFLRVATSFFLATHLTSSNFATQEGKGEKEVQPQTQSLQEFKGFILSDKDSYFQGLAEVLPSQDGYPAVLSPKYPQSVWESYDFRLGVLTSRSIGKEISESLGESILVVCRAFEKYQKVTTGCLAFGESGVYWENSAGEIFKYEAPFKDNQWISLGFVDFLDEKLVIPLVFLVEEEGDSEFIRGFYDDSGRFIPYDVSYNKDILEKKGEFVVEVPFRMLPTPSLEDLGKNASLEKNFDERINFIPGVQNGGNQESEYPETQLPIPIVTKEIDVNDKQDFSLSCEASAVGKAVGYVAKYLGIKLSEGYKSWEDYFVKNMPSNPNPFRGFRGKINGRPGSIVDYGVYARAFLPLLEQLGIPARDGYGGGNPYREVEDAVKQGFPVVIWETSRNYQVVYEKDKETGEVFPLIPYEHVWLVIGVDEKRGFLIDNQLGVRIWVKGFPRWKDFNYMRLIIGAKNVSVPDKDVLDSKSLVEEKPF